VKQILTYVRIQVYPGRLNLKYLSLIQPVHKS